MNEKEVADRISMQIMVFFGVWMAGVVGLFVVGVLLWEFW